MFQTLDIYVFQIENSKINDSKLPAVISCRDLGVIFLQNLKPAEHIGQMVAKAHQRASAILQCKRYITLFCVNRC